MSQKNIFQDNSPEFQNTELKIPAKYDQEKPDCQVLVVYFQASLVIAILALSALLFNITNDLLVWPLLKPK